MSPHKLFVFFLDLTLSLNAIVSTAIALSGYFSWRQKIAQVLLVWLVPILGGVMIGLFLLAEGPQTRARTNTVGAVDIDDNAARLPSTISRDT